MAGNGTSGSGGPDRSGPGGGGDRGFEPPVGGYQPPDHGDLARFPPRDDGCRAVREMLRDHCDGELSPAATRHVDEHVHACRDCALALSRMELEVLRLRQAFDPERAVAADVPPDLTSGVMRRIGDVLLAEGDLLDADGVSDGEPVLGRDAGTSGRSPNARRGPSAPPLFTRRVMERVRREWPRPSGLGRLWSGKLWSGRRSRGLALLAGALVVAAGLTFALWAGGREPVGPRFEIVAAADAALERDGGGTEPARPGRALRPGDVLRAAGLQDVRLERVDPAGADPSRPMSAAREVRVVVDSGSACRALADGGLELLDGTLRVDADAPLLLGLPDGVRVRMSGAAAWVTVMPVRRHDAAWTGESVQRVRVEVVRGRASVERGIADPIVVAAGQVARFDTWSAVDLEAGPSSDLLARSSRAGRAPAVAAVGGRDAGALGAVTWTGRVVDAGTGSGVARAEVQVRIGGAALQVERTDADGWFDFTATDRDATTAIVRVVPPLESPLEDGAGFAGFGPEPVALSAAGAARIRRLGPIALGPDAPVRGVVWSAAGGRVEGARVVPHVVDELFAVAERLADLAAVSDSEGRFAIRGLPADLPRHQTLALVVEKHGLPRHVQLSGGSTVDVVVPAPRELIVAGLAPNAEFRVLRELPGVSMAVLSEELRARADANGAATLDGVGPGSLWVVDDDGPALRPLVADASSGTLRVASEARGPERFERLRSEPQGFLERRLGVASLLAAGNRFAAAAVAPDPRSARYVTIRHGRRGFALGAQLFLEDGGGAVLYLGEVDASGVVAFDEPDGSYRLVAVGPDGAFGVVDDAGLDAEQGRIGLVEPGAVRFDGEPRAVLTPGALVSFDAVGGVFDGRRLWRVVDAEHGFVARDLPPGDYRVTLPDGRAWMSTVVSGVAVPLGERVGSGKEPETSGR